MPKNTVKMYPEDDLFFKYFDEEGNFIEKTEENSQKNES